MAEGTKLIGQLSIGIEKLKSDIILAEQELKKLDKYRNMTLTVKFDSSTTKMFSSLASQLDKIIGSFSKLNTAMKTTDTQAQQTAKSVNRVLVGASNLGTPYKVIENKNAQGKTTSTRQTFIDPVTGYQNQVLTNAQGGMLAQSKVVQDAGTKINTAISKIITDFNLLDAAARRDKANIQAAITALTRLSQTENIFVGDLKKVLAAKIQMENADKRLTAETQRLANAQAKSEITKVMNQYKALSLEEQKRVVNIRTTISAIDALMVKYSTEANIISILLARKNQLLLVEQRTNASTGTRVSGFANEKFTQLLHQYNTELITTEQYLKKLSMFKNSRFFGYLTDANQVRVINEYNRALKETARLQREADYKPLNNALANYKMLSAEEQKRPGNIRVLIAEYDKLIAKYRLEGKAVTQLIADRNKLDQAIKSNLASATVEYQNILRQNGLVRNSMMTTTGLAGQKRYGVMDKIANSMIYTTSGMIYGQSIMAVRNAVQTNKDYETSLNSLSRTLGQVTDKDLRMYGEEAKRLAKEFGVPIQSVMDALIELARAGYDTQEQLIPMTRTVLLGLNTTEIANAADMVSYLVAAVKQLGLEEMNTTEIVDKWNFLADKYAVTTDDFAEATKKAGSASKLLGIDLDTLNAMVVILGEQTQASGSEIGTALKTLETRLLRPETVKTMEDLGIVVKEDADHFKTFQEIMSQVAKKLDEFGDGSVKSVELLDALGGAWRRNQITILGQNWGDIEGIKSRSAIEAIGWSMKENEKVMQTYAKSIELLKVAFAELALAIGQAGLFNQLKALTDGIKGAVNWFNQLQPSIQRSIVIFFELSVLLSVVRKAFTGIFGMEALNMMLLYMAQFRSLNLQFLGFKLTLTGIAAAQTMVNSVAQTGLITEAERLAINEAIAAQQMTTLGRQQAMVLQQQAFTVAINQSRIAAVGFNIAMSAGIMIAVAGIAYLISQYQEAQAAAEKAKQDAADSTRVYTEQKKELSSLKQEYMNLLPTLNDTKEAKNSLIGVEERLNNLYDSGTEKLNLQRNALSKNLKIFREAEEAKARAFINETGAVGRAAGEKLQEKSTRTYEGLSTQKTFLGKLESVFDYDWFNKLIESTASVKKKAVLEGTGMVEHPYRETDKVSLEITGTIKEQYTAIDKILTSVNARMATLNKNIPEQADEYNKLDILVKKLTPDYNKLRDELKLLEDQLQQYNDALKIMAESEIGKQFELIFKKPINAIQEGMEGLTTGMSAADLQDATANFNAQFDAMRNSLMLKTQAGEIGGAESTTMTTMINNLQAVVVNALNNMSGTAVETTNVFEDLTESFAEFEAATNTLAGALSELNENGGLSVQSALKLLETYPELAGAMTVEGNIIKMNGDALRDLWELKKLEQISDIENSKASAVAAYDSLKLKLSYYITEGNALKDLSAIQQMEMQKSIDKRKSQIDELNKGLAGMPPEFAATQTEGIERDEAYLQALDYEEKIKALNKRLEMLQMPLDAWIPPDKGAGEDLTDYTDYIADSALLAKDRYYKLNLELEKTNTLLAKNKALQENATEKEKIVLMREEIELLKRKQENIHNIAHENRIEREELVTTLGTGFQYEGYGDELTIANAKEMLDMKKDELDNINPKLNAVNKQLYEDLKAEIELMEKNLGRFFELQLKLIPSAQQEWLGLEKSINEVGKAISAIYLANYQKLVAGLRSTEDMIKSAITERDDLRKQALQDELDGIEEAEDAAWEAYQNDVKNKRKQYEDRYQIIIDGLNKEKSALRKAYDESKEKKEDEKLQEELAMLQAKYVNMARENSGRFEKEKVEAQKKIVQLQETIAERAADKLVKSEEEKLDLQIDTFEKLQKKELEDFNKSVDLEEEKYKTKDDFLKGDWSNFNKYSNERKLAIKRELDDLDTTSKEYWDRINRETLGIMKSGEDNIIAFLKMNSAEYYNAGEFKAKEMMRGWNAALEDAKLSEGVDTELIKSLQEKFIKAQQEGDIAGMIQAATAANDERTSHGLAPENVEYIADLYKQREAKVETIMPGKTSPIPGVTGNLEYQGLYENIEEVKPVETAKPTVSEKELNKAYKWKILIDIQKQKYIDAEAEGDLAGMIKAAINADNYRLELGEEIQNTQTIRDLIQQRKDKLAANPDLNEPETIAGYTNNKLYKDRYGFALGGINTQKGLYALHGTPQSSEVIFNAGQAKKLFEFVNSLNTITIPFNNIMTSMAKMSESPSNFNIESIVVNVDKLDSDVDYDELATKVGDSIYKKAGFTSFSVRRR